MFLFVCFVLNNLEEGLRNFKQLLTSYINIFYRVMPLKKRLSTFPNHLSIMTTLIIPMFLQA